MARLERPSGNAERVDLNAFLEERKVPNAARGAARPDGKADKGKI